MKLKALSITDLEQVRQWRNSQIEMLRTPFFLTQEMQEKFYHDVICNRNSNARFWGIFAEVGNIYPSLIGMCGLENISWENRNAEISLILNPEYIMDKYGKEAIRLLLHEGFMSMNLENIFTEVYDCNPNKHFWINEYMHHINTYVPITTLPNRKYWNGKYYDSYYINFNKERYNENSVS